MKERESKLIFIYIPVLFNSFLFSMVFQEVFEFSWIKGFVIAVPMCAIWEHISNLEHKLIGLMDVNKECSDATETLVDKVDNLESLIMRNCSKNNNVEF